MMFRGVGGPAGPPRIETENPLDRTPGLSARWVGPKAGLPAPPPDPRQAGGEWQGAGGKDNIILLLLLESRGIRGGGGGGPGSISSLAPLVV